MLATLDLSSGVQFTIMPQTLSTEDRRVRTAMIERSRCPFSDQDRGRRPAGTVTLRAWLFRFWLGICILWPSLARGQEVGAPEKAKSAEAAPGTPTPQAPADDKRTELNLLGKTEVEAGGSRRTESV